MNSKLHSFALACILWLAGAPAVAVEVGQVAPTLNLPARQGSVDLSALKGKVVYLDFWASWCAPCRQSFPWMNEMQARYGNQGLRVVAVNLDAQRKDADKFLAEVPANITIAFDPQGDSPKRYQIKGMPSSVLIGADGKVLATHTGFRDDQRAQLEQMLVAALKGQKLPTHR